MIGVIIQARMGSTRLPGKTMYKINDRPLLQYSVERVGKARYVDKVIVATTMNEKDDEIFDWCKENKITVYRGSEDDVLDRYYQAAVENDLDIIIRVTSDCPFVDPSIIDMLITSLMNYDCDYISNRWKTRSWPHGLDVEVIKREALYDAWVKANKAYEREHVTPYILENEGEFSIIELPLNQDLSSIRLTVDYPEDMQFAESTMRQLMKEHSLEFGWRDILALLIAEPDLLKMNKELVNTKLY